MGLAINMKKIIFKIWGDLTLTLTSLLFLLACGTGSGGNASPIPPEEIPLAASIGTIIEIPFASNPIVSTTNTEITGGGNSIMTLSYFQHNDSIPIDDLFTTVGTSHEAACATSWAVAKPMNMLASADQMLCILKNSHTTLQDAVPNLYDGDEHIFTKSFQGSLFKFKISVAGSSTGSTITNITGFTMHVCQGTSESDLTLSDYGKYTRTAFDGNKDTLVVDRVYISPDDTTQKVRLNMTTYNDASLDLITEKVINFESYLPWNEGDGGLDYAESTVTIGKNNFNIDGYGHYTDNNNSNPADRIWQFSSVGELFIDDYDNYNVQTDTRIGDMSINFILNQGTQTEVCYQSDTMQADTCPGLFSDSDALTIPPAYQSSLTITLTDEENWDCSGDATTLSSDTEDEEESFDCSAFRNMAYGATTNCHSTF